MSDRNKEKKNNRPLPGKRAALRPAPFVAISFFVILLILGVAMGEPRRVLEQAIAVCLSCIGIG